ARVTALALIEILRFAQDDLRMIASRSSAGHLCAAALDRSDHVAGAVLDRIAYSRDGRAAGLEVDGGSGQDHYVPGCIHDYRGSRRGNRNFPGRIDLIGGAVGRDRGGGAAWKRYS